MAYFSLKKHVALNSHQRLLGSYVSVGYHYVLILVSWEGESNGGMICSYLLSDPNSTKLHGIFIGLAKSCQSI